VANPFQDKLNQLSRLHKRRALIPIQGIDFSSNDYLALASHVGIRQSLVDALQGEILLGAGGSRLLRGNHIQHENLETFAADYFGAEACLFMSTGYLANLAIFTSLPTRTDAIVFDEYSHASTKEGIHAATSKSYKFAHNDMMSCEDALKRARKNGAKTVWIAVESVYSMDGDMCPLDQIMDIANRHDAFVIVDEAHATGIHGPEGRGLSAAFEGQENLLALHTCGKALGQSGALVTMSSVLKDYMVNCARSFIYTTAPSPLAAVAVHQALTVVRDEPERRRALEDLSVYTRNKIEPLFDMNTSTSQIIPLLVGKDGDAFALAQKLQYQGFDIRAIRTPTVPNNTARLRLSVTLNVSSNDVDGLAQALEQALERMQT